jgi:hypothetical protein
MKKKFCPLLRIDCMESCAWYIEGADSCVMQVLPDVLMSLNEPPCAGCEHEEENEEDFSNPELN